VKLALISIFHFTSLLFLLVFCKYQANAQIITTIAGTGVAGFSGDGGPATAAQLKNTSRLAIDRIGNIYVADFANERVRMISTSGIITTFAGNGVAAYISDGVAASTTSFNGPTGLAVDTIGNVYIADQSNHRIRKVDTSGIVTTVAGTGTAGSSGDGGPATAAMLNRPISVCTDIQGNILITSNYEHCIRKVNSAGIITTVAGNGNMGFSGDGGPATAAKMQWPCDAISDTAGNIFIADTYNNRIRKVDASGIITTFAGTGAPSFSGDGGPASLAGINKPHSLAFDKEGNLLFSDIDNYRVRKINTAGYISTITGDGTLGYSGDGGPATAAKTGIVTGICVDTAGSIYISNNSNFRVRKIYAEHTGTCDMASKNVNSITISPNPAKGTFQLIVSSPTNETVKGTIYNMLGRLIKEFAVTTNSETNIQIKEPVGIYFVSVKMKTELIFQKIVLE